MEATLLTYQKTKNPVELISKYQTLLESFSALVKGRVQSSSTRAKWFYGLFLEGVKPTRFGLQQVQETLVEMTYWLTDEESYQQVVLFFLSIASGFKEQVGKSQFHQYIRMALGWRLKNWLEPYYYQQDAKMVIYAEEEYPQETEPFRLNLSWVLTDTRSPLFHGLRAYDRYLIYLYYVEEYTIRQIADTTQQNKNTVNKDLERIKTHCKSNSVREAG